GDVDHSVGRRCQGIADAGDASPTLLATTYEPYAAVRDPGPDRANLPERSVDAPAASPHGLEVRPRIGGLEGDEIDQHHASGEQPVIARIAFDHHSSPCVGRERQPLRLPPRLVDGVRGARLQVVGGYRAFVPARPRMF